MGKDTIDDILEKRKQAEKPAAPPPAEIQEDKFFSILVGEGVQEHFLELRTRDGLRTCFSYTDIVWFSHDPDGILSMDFGGYKVAIEGRGLVPRLFEGVRQKRVAWIKEADHEMQDHKDNDTFVAKIVIEPPDGFPEEPAQPAE